MNLEDAIAEAAVERIYILIGASDLGGPAHFSAFFDNWDTMLGRIREKSPNVEIVIISIIPRYGTQTERTGPLFRQYNTDVIDTNEKLREYAGDNGCLYIDLHAYIEDHSGCMAAIYNLDGFHLNDTGYRTWMKVMRYYAQYELEGGTLS